MAGATVIVPLLTLHRTVAAPTVWPINVPLLTLHRHPLTPSMSLSATVHVPLLTIHRTAYAPFVGGFTPSSATITFAIQHGQHRFDITKADVTPAG